MASLSSILLDQKKISEGAWVTVQVGGEPCDIRTRGFTPRYRDLLYRLRVEAMRDENRGKQPGAALVSVDTLPPSVEDRCYGRALAEECFLDVRGLALDKGGPDVTADEVNAMLREPVGCTELVVLVLGAAGRLTNERAEEVQTAAGN